MSHIKCAALLDKAFNFMRVAAGTPRNKLGNQISHHYSEIARLKGGQIYQHKARKPDEAVIKNLDKGIGEHYNATHDLKPKYEAAKKDTIKARAYLLGGAAVAGSAGVGVAISNKRKKDRQTQERINTQYQKEGE